MPPFVCRYSPSLSLTLLLSHIPHRIVETNISLVCSSMPAFASLSKNRLFSWSYLSTLRDRLLSSLHLSTNSNFFKIGGSQDTHQTSVQKHAIDSYGTGTFNPSSQGHSKNNAHSASGQGPETEARSSLSACDIELGKIQRSASLQQLVSNAS